MIFFHKRESVGTPLVSHIFSSGGDAFTKKVPLLFRRFYSNGFGFNFFINFAWETFFPTLLCKLLLLFATTVWFYFLSFFVLFLVKLELENGEELAETCNWDNFKL